MIPPSSPASGLRQFALIALMAFLTVVDLFATQAILPSLAAAYGVSPAAMSLAVNASTFGMAVASLAMAFFGGHLDRRLGISVALAFLAVPTLLLSVAPNLAVFAALRVAQGLCMASAFALTLTYLGEHSSAQDRAGAFAAYITGNVASNLVGRLASATLTLDFGIAANFAAFAVLNLAGAWLAWVYVEATPKGGAHVMSMSPFAAVAMHLRNPALLATFGIGFCILFAFIGTFSFVNFVLMRPPLGLGMMELGLVYFVFLPSIATTPVAGAFAARMGARPALWGGLAIAGAGLPLLLSGSVAAVIAGLGMVAAGTFFAQAVATGFVGRAAEAERGAASGIYLASYFSGGLVGTAVLGQLFDRFGWPACAGGVAAALAVAAVLGLRLVLPPAREAV